MMRNSIKVKKNSLYFLMLTAFVATVAYCMKSPTTCLIVVLLQLGAILWTAKVSLFSVLLSTAICSVCRNRSIWTFGNNRCSNLLL